MIRWMNERASGFGLLHHELDAHTLGMAQVADLLGRCGVRTSLADADSCADAARLVSGPAPGGSHALRRWIRDERLGAIGFSYRLDPQDALRHLGAFLEFLKREGLDAPRGGPVAAVFFAGLPEAAELAEARFPELAGCFRGGETDWETLDLLGIPRSAIPAELKEGARYDEARLQFGREIARKADYLGVGPVDRTASPRFGKRGEHLTDRVDHGRAAGLPPLIRAHAGPYLPDRREALALFNGWAASLARGGLLDVLSIGTSQLTQERFGDTWGDAPNGGGVPINSEEEYAEVWRAARPMLVRTYAGSRNVPSLAEQHERSLDIAWHALSLWWFSVLDGRGPNSVRANLDEHFRAMRYISGTGKPLEPNVPHHFAFRGADDAAYVLSGYVAARAAKACGIRTLVLQTMLNTPRHTWGVQDLAKARALLTMARTLEDRSFRIILQPRGGLDYFSSDPDTARAQLAAVTALMDDIEPGVADSPQIIHVVSHSEGRGLADPPVIEESIRITRHALAEYRRLRAAGEVDDMGADAEVRQRTAALLAEARALAALAERLLPDPWSPAGLYAMLRAGFFPLPQLAHCRGEFPEACCIRTGMQAGGVRVLGPDGLPLPREARLAGIEAALLRAGRPGGGTA